MGIEMSETIEGPDGRPRCHWCVATPGYLHYHDHEWGFPVAEDRRLFEKLCLEGFMSGLSWRTILEKRENFRAAFHNFDFARIALFTEQDVERLLQDAGIVRHRGKIEAVINNAKRLAELIEKEGSLAAYAWRFEPGAKDRQEAATSMSKDLKKRGWSFVGPTTVYSFMQAMGLFNDHAEGCAIRAEADAARKSFQRPV
jgi:DNA-3-methyladenine glycosylase I